MIFGGMMNFRTIKPSILLIFLVMGITFVTQARAEELDVKPKVLSTPIPAASVENMTNLETEPNPQNPNQQNNVVLENLQTKQEDVTFQRSEAETSVAIEPIEESKIPVLTNVKKAEESTSGAMFKIIFAILGICLSGVGIYIYLKRVSKQINTKSSLMQIKVLTQHHLGPKKSIAVIRVAGESILIGITDHNINVLKTLSLLDEELPEVTPQDFKTTLNEEYKAENKKSSLTTTEVNTTDDDFEFAGIRDMVTSKIKNYRRI